MKQFALLFRFQLFDTAIKFHYKRYQKFCLYLELSSLVLVQ